MPGNQPSLERQSDIDIGYNQSFEEAWGCFERYAWLVITILIVAGLLGLFGRGPLNQVTRPIGQTGSVRYGRIVRFKTPTVIDFVLPLKNGTATLRPDAQAIKMLGLRNVFPKPTKTLASPGAGCFVFTADPTETKTIFVQLSFQPSGVGSSRSTYFINEETPVRVEQFVIP